MSTNKPLADVSIFIVGRYFGARETLVRYYETAFTELGATVMGWDDYTPQDGNPHWGDWKDERRNFDVLFVLKGGGFWQRGVQGISAGWALNEKAFRVEKHKEILEKAGSDPNFRDLKTVLYWPDPLEDYTSLYATKDYLEQNKLEPKMNIHYLDDLSKGKFYDHIYLANCYPKEDMDRAGWKWLPVAMDPQNHWESVDEKPERGRVCFIGTKKPGREFIPKLEPKPYIYGNDWSKQDGANKEVYFAEKRRAVCQASAVLSHHSSGHGPNHTDFECGGFHRVLIADEVLGMKECGFEEGINYVKYVDAKTCQDAIDWVGRAGRKSLHLANNLRRLCVERHTYKHRALQLLKEIGVA